MSRARPFRYSPPHWVGTIWKKYSHRIYKLCLKKCGTREDADDLFQEVALRFCRKAWELNNGINLLPWFETVLLNCHYTRHRRENMDRVVRLASLCDVRVGYEGDDICTFVIPDNRVSSDAVMNEFKYLLDVLDPLDRMIVELSVIGGLGVRDLSRLIGLSKSNIVSRRVAAFEKMREKMEIQKEELKLITGHDATLREIIESAS